MAFRPDRQKLNANFEGYKLSKDSLSCVTEPLPSDVHVAQLKEEQFSYQHVRSFSLHNHLVLDPWDQSSVYWYAEGRIIQRAKFEPSSDSMTISPVYRCEPHPSKPSGDYVVNASIVFLTESLCLFSDGDGSLQLLQTRNPGSDAPLTADSSNQWTLIENLNLTGLEGAPFMVLAARVSPDDEQQLDIATLELKDPSSFGRSSKNLQPTVAIYRWHKLHFSSKLTADVLQSRDDSSTDTSHVEESKLCCTLESHAIALYCDFLKSNLLIVSESNLVNHNNAGHDPSSEEFDPADNDVMESDEATKPHLGLGYTQEGSKRPYTWSQSETDVTITVPLPPDATKQDIDCIIGRAEVVVGLTDGTTFVRGTLYSSVDPEASAWTIEEQRVEVSLEKKDSGVTWPSLLAGEEEGQRLPLAEGLSTGEFSKQELEEMEKKITEASERKHPGDESEAPQSKRPRPMVDSTQEECDTTDENATLFVVREDGSVTQRSGLGGRHILFTARTSPTSPDLLCLRHDVDAIVWQPSTPTATDDPSSITWSHKETFNALGYIQSAKEDKKFTTCPSNFSFAAISDCTRHVFVYRQPPEGVKGNEAAQYVHTILSETGILGLQATNTGLVFVLCTKKLLVLLVK